MSCPALASPLLCKNPLKSSVTMGLKGMPPISSWPGMRSQHRPLEEEVLSPIHRPTARHILSASMAKLGPQACKTQTSRSAPRLTASMSLGLPRLPTTFGWGRSSCPTADLRSLHLRCECIHVASHPLLSCLACNLVQRFPRNPKNPLKTNST